MLRAIIMLVLYSVVAACLLRDTAAVADGMDARLLRMGAELDRRAR